ncbi:hypothetical protein [Myxococcus eversor]|uniref:hypothetical protein n=1 Tax=Myxococcus eversor TaxID=2709661 RepID=UPI003084473F
MLEASEAREGHLSCRGHRAHRHLPGAHHVEEGRLHGPRAQREHPHEQRLFRLVRAFLAPRVEALRPKDLDMAVFILVHSVETLCIKAVSDRPDYLTNETFLDELGALMQGYLQPAGESARATPKRATGRRRNPASREITTSS